MSQEEKRIYVETIMTPEEWKARCKEFPSTSTNTKVAEYFNSEFKWRYKMGDFLNKEEIALINKRMDTVLKAVKKDEDRKS